MTPGTAIETQGCGSVGIIPSAKVVLRLCLVNSVTVPLALLLPVSNAYLIAELGLEAPSCLGHMKERIPVFRRGCFLLFRTTKLPGFFFKHHPAGPEDR